MKRILSALFVVFCGLFCPAFAQPTTSSAATYWEETRAAILREIEQLKQVVSNDPNVTSYFKLGSLYNSLGQWNDAAAAFEKATALKLDHAESLYELGWAYSRLGKHEEALVAQQRAANLGPKEVAVWFAIGWEQYFLQRYDAALAAYQKAIAANSEFAGAYYELGRTYLAAGKRTEASELLKALEERDRYLAELLAREILRGIPTSVSTPVQAEKNQTSPQAASKNLKPTITYKEKARYTEAARQYRVQGTVLISVVFTADGRITSIRVVRGLPLGLAEEAVKAAEKLRFTPATKDGQPVSVRMSMEFAFNLM